MSTKIGASGIDQSSLSVRAFQLSGTKSICSREPIDLFEISQILARQKTEITYVPYRGHYIES